uniref:Uncharacterized protein n=1 Tax=Anguilla anguilla TaxID=7936 RepID=A0A0E9TVP2_ANGAN
MLAPVPSETINAFAQMPNLANSHPFRKCFI